MMKNVMVKEEVKQNFEVFTQLTIPVSVQVTASSHEEAEMIASLQLDQDAIQRVFLNLLLHNGQIVTPTVHNWESEGQYAIGEDE